MYYLRQFSYKRNRQFYQSLIKLAIPMAFISLLNSLLNLTDNLMISRLGEESIAAVGSSNKLFFLLMLTLFGINSGFGAFIAQFWGKKDIKRIHSVLFLAILSGSLLASVVMIVAKSYPHLVLGFFSDDPLVIALGSDYLRIVSFSYVISAVLFSFNMTSRSTEKPMLPLLAVFLGVIVNVILNYILIFGNFGFKALGVEGAAIATLIARSCQLLIYILYIFIRRDPVLLINPINIRIEGKLLERLLIKTTPVVINEFLWSLGLILIFKAYGKLGTNALASIQLFDTLFSMLTVFTWGISSASAIMIGKKLGELDYSTAKEYSKLFIFNSLFLGSLTGIMFILMYPFVPLVFDNLNNQVIHNLQMLLLIMMIFTPFKLLSNTFIIGILRSAGDTLFAMTVEGGVLWIWGVSIAFLLVRFTNFPLPIIFIFVNMELIIKDIICFIRFKKGRYIHNLVH